MSDPGRIRPWTGERVGTDVDRATSDYEHLYREHARAIHAYCLRRTTPEDAKDATADVFVVAWRRFAEMPGGDAALPWLYGVARNVLNDRRRSLRRMVRLSAKLAATGTDAVEGPEPQVVRHEEHAQVLAAIERLPEKDREILRLVEWEGLTRDQVAEMLYLSRSAIDKRMTRAQAKIARILGVTSDVRTTPVPAEEGGEA
jgi:RNA polymerase sigma-70 factor, ECF subfamily